MVCMYGMSEKLGPIKYGNFPSHPHMRIDMPPEDAVSPETAREIDLEIRRISERAMQSARDCLNTHRDELEKLAQALLERETLSIDEINELLGRKPEPDDTGRPETTLRPTGRRWNCRAGPLRRSTAARCWCAGFSPAHRKAGSRALTARIA